MKKLCSIVLVGILLLSVTACTRISEQSNDGMSTSDKSVEDASVSSDVLLTDKELEDRMLYLIDPYILPVYWYTGDGSERLDVFEMEHVKPLENTPKDTTFYEVLRFNSIEDMKQSTEQIVTKEFAEQNLYPLLEKHKQFLERNGKLYYNTSAGSGGPVSGPVKATVLSKTENDAILSVVFQDLDGAEEEHQIELKKESGTWKLNNYPYLD